MGVMHLERERERERKLRRKIGRKIGKEALDYFQDEGLVRPLLGAEAGPALGTKAGPAVAGAGYAKAGALVFAPACSEAGIVVAATALGPVGNWHPRRGCCCRPDARCMETFYQSLSFYGFAPSPSVLVRHDVQKQRE